jgi:hypothetical protein
MFNAFQSDVNETCKKGYGPYGILPVRFFNFCLNICGYRNQRIHEPMPSVSASGDIVGAEGRAEMATAREMRVVDNKGDE